MKKKSSIIELSVPELLVKMKGKRIARKVDDKDIDFSEMPELSKSQLKKMKRAGRPLLGDVPRKAISIRVDENVLKKLKAKAKNKDIPYQSLINEILKKAVG